MWSAWSPFGMHLPVEHGELRQSQERISALEREREILSTRHRRTLQRHGRILALGIAIRHVRSAGSRRAMLAAIEEVLVQLVGVRAFILSEMTTSERRVLVARGVPLKDVEAVAADLASRVDASSSGMTASGGPLALIALGADGWRCGYLAVLELAAHKPALDPYDRDLLEALGPPITVLLQAQEASASRPTIIPRSTRPLR